jgi:hypothetical protein
LKKKEINREGQDEHDERKKCRVVFLSCLSCSSLFDLNFKLTRYLSVGGFDSWALEV